MNELQSASSFSQYAGQNEEAFLQSAACPFCGAQLPKDASYCIACMRPLRERRVIPARKRNAGKPARMLTGILSALAVLLLAAAVYFFLIRPPLLPKASLDLPSAAEFRVLAAGASEEDSKMLWSQEAFTLAGSKNGFSIYETETPLSEEPLRAAFSDDGKCLYIALTGIPGNSVGEAGKLLKTVFSAVYRYVPENLEELLSADDAFTENETAGATLSALLETFEIRLSQDAEIRESLPIRTDRYPGGPAARIYKSSSDGHFSLFVCFGPEAP